MVTTRRGTSTGGETKSSVKKKSYSDFEVVTQPRPRAKRAGKFYRWEGEPPNYRRVEMSEEEIWSHIDKVTDSEADAGLYTGLEYKGPFRMTKFSIESLLDDLKGYCNTAIQPHNTKQGTNLKAVDVVEATCGGLGCADEYYLTFTAAEAEVEAEDSSVYQAKVRVPYCFTGKPLEVLKFRPKPSSYRSRELNYDGCNGERPSFLKAYFYS